MSNHLSIAILAGKKGVIAKRIKKHEKQGLDVPEEWVNELSGAEERLKEALSENAGERKERTAKYKKEWSKEQREKKKQVVAVGKRGEKKMCPDWYAEPLGEVDESSSDDDEYIYLGLDESSDDGTTPTPTTCTTPTVTVAPVIRTAAPTACTTPTASTDPVISADPVVTAGPARQKLDEGLSAEDAAISFKKLGGPPPSTDRHLNKAFYHIRMMILDGEAEALATEWVVTEQKRWREEERIVIEKGVRAELKKEEAARELYDKTLGS